MGWASTAQGRGPFSEPLSFPPQNCPLGGYPGFGQGGLNSLALWVVPVACSRPASQSCAGCPHWASPLSFPIMQPKGPAQPQTQWQCLSSAWFPGTPSLPHQIRGDKKETKFKKTKEKISLAWHSHLSSQLMMSESSEPSEQ